MRNFDFKLPHDAAANGSGFLIYLGGYFY